MVSEIFFAIQKNLRITHQVHNYNAPNRYSHRVLAIQQIQVGISLSTTVLASRVPEHHLDAQILKNHPTGHPILALSDLEKC